jgi:hypothetical protein
LVSAGRLPVEGLPPDHGHADKGDRTTTDHEPLVYFVVTGRDQTDDHAGNR